MSRYGTVPDGSWIVAQPFHKNRLPSGLRYSPLPARNQPATSGTAPQHASPSRHLSLAKRCAWSIRWGHEDTCHQRRTEQDGALRMLPVSIPDCSGRGTDHGRHDGRPLADQGERGVRPATWFLSRPDPAQQRKCGTQRHHLQRRHDRVRRQYDRTGCTRDNLSPAGRGQFRAVIPEARSGLPGLPGLHAVYAADSWCHALGPLSAIPNAGAAPRERVEPYQNGRIRPPDECFRERCHVAHTGGRQVWRGMR